jgi:photosystem II stability/assembly factor-like uncharacterized protein
MFLEALLATTLAGGWETHGPAPSASAVAVAGPDSRRVYAIAGSVFRSDDGGATWLRIFDAPPGTGLLNILQVDPLNGDRLFVATNQAGPRSHFTTTFYRSLDGGDTWTMQLTVGDGPLCSMALGGQAVYVACRGYQPVFFHSEDGGDSFDGGWATFFGLGVPILETTPDGALVSTSGWQSRDGGQTWQPWIYIPVDCSFTSLTIDSSNPNRIFVSEGDRYGLCGAVLRSVDGGLTWSRTADVGGPALDLVMDMSDPSLIYVSTAPVGQTPGRVLVSSDDGQSWQDLGLPVGAGASDLALTEGGDRLYAATPAGVYARSLRRSRAIPPRP